MGASVIHGVDLSLTENLIPVIINTKQFDNMARKVSCKLYKNSIEYAVPDGVIVTCTGTRPDGAVFQYSSETASDLVYVDDGEVVFTITDFMSRVSGRFPVDIALLTESKDGMENEVIGTFSLTLKVERAALKSKGLATYTYAGMVKAIYEGILAVYITDDGYFAISSSETLGMSTLSESSTLDKVLDAIVNCTVNDDGYLAFTTEDGLYLTFTTDEYGRLVVTYEG